MSTPEIRQKIHQKIDQLLPNELNLLSEFLDFLSFKTQKTATSSGSKRKGGLHSGAFIVSDDFDEPLPDSFWLGEEWSYCSIHTPLYGETVHPVKFGKLILKTDLATLVRQQQTENGISLLPISLTHILNLNRLPYHHKNPFDHILISQARAELATLVTLDKTFDYS